MMTLEQFKPMKMKTKRRKIKIKMKMKMKMKSFTLKSLTASIGGTGLWLLELMLFWSFCYLFMAKRS